MVIRYPSIAAFVDVARNGPLHHRGSSSVGTSWTLGINNEQALELAAHGDTSIVPAMIDGLDMIDPTVADQLRGVWRNDVAGSRVNVPAYLAGRPDCMRRRVRDVRATREVSIYVDLTCSAGVDARDMLRRGVTILGLLEALQRSGVAVSLYLVIGTHGEPDGSLYQVIEVDSRPLDLSTAGFALAHPAFSRGLAYGVAGRYGFDGGWPRNMNARAVLGLAPTDVYVPAVQYRDPLIADPVAWVKARLSQLTRS